MVETECSFRAGRAYHEEGAEEAQKGRNEIARGANPGITDRTQKMSPGGATDGSVWVFSANRASFSVAPSGLGLFLNAKFPGLTPRAHLCRRSAARVERFWRLMGWGSQPTVCSDSWCRRPACTLRPGSGFLLRTFPGQAGPHHNPSEPRCGTSRMACHDRTGRG